MKRIEDQPEVVFGCPRCGKDMRDSPAWRFTPVPPERMFDRAVLRARAHIPEHNHPKGHRCPASGITHAITMGMADRPAFEAWFDRVQAEAEAKR